MQYVAHIRTRKPRRVVPAVWHENRLVQGDPCIVQTDRGMEWGVCVLPPEPILPEVAKRYIHRILRTPSAEDEKTLAAIVEEERHAVPKFLECVKKYSLPMRLVDVELSFDRKKMTFFFTADGRVDFREMLKELSAAVHVRIELRHIQVRDAAVMVGGLGGCGRELCCATWLSRFKTISMRMAKVQNLALNPSKISGQCGRLLCCLSYEYEVYRAMQKQKGEPEPPEEQEPEEDLDVTQALLDESRL